MGYEITHVDSQFQIPADRKAAALAAVRALVGIRDTVWSWVSDDDITTAETLEALFELWGYPVETNAAGDITGIDFEGEKAGDEGCLFDAVAPFVVPGSFIQMAGEDGAVWRWKFDGQTCKEVTAKMSFEDDG